MSASDAGVHAAASWTYVRGERAEESLLRIRRALKEPRGWWDANDEADYQAACEAPHAHEGTVCLTSGAPFRVIQAAIEDPAAYCSRLTSYPSNSRAMEPMERWQTRAVMCVLRARAR